MNDLNNINDCITELNTILKNINNPMFGVNIRRLIVKSTNVFMIMKKYNIDISNRIGALVNKGLVNNMGQIYLVDLGRLYELVIQSKNIIENDNFWKDINPRISNFSKEQYLNRDYLACIRNSVIEINTYLKKLYKEKRNKELDGANLMGAVFNKNTPLIELEDLTTEDGNNIQQGFQKIAEGTIQAGRNPFAHTNRNATESEAKHYIYLSSLIMNKIEGGIVKE